MRRNQQHCIVGFLRVAGEEIEKFGNIRADGIFTGEEPNVFIQPRSGGVVVTGTNMNVATHLVGVVAHHEYALRVRL